MSNIAPDTPKVSAVFNPNHLRKGIASPYALATTDPNPKLTNMMGNAQQISVGNDVNRSKAPHLRGF